MVDIIGMYPYWNFVQKKKAFIPMLLVIISTVYAKERCKRMMNTQRDMNMNIVLLEMNMIEIHYFGSQR